MYLDEQYTMYHLAYHLVREKNYDVIHLNVKDNELWLEKYENNTSKVIRLFQKGFDWKNHLRLDIANVFQRTKVMKNMLIGKTIEIYNIYVASYPPVDNWESLKQPLQLRERKPPKMKVYYVSEDNKNEELSRFQKDIGMDSFINEDGDLSEMQTEDSIHFYKIELANALYDKRKQVENIFSYGKPIFIYPLMILNIIMFFILEANGGSMNIQTLIQYGAKFNPAIVDGEWWRFISSMFLHVGFLHLFMNMIALYYLGTMVEKIYGSWRFIWIYFLAGIGGSITSFVLTTNVSAGASGAIFGLFGALLFFGLIHKKIFFQTIGKGLLFIIAINIMFGLFVPQIDNGAHLGGLLCGFIASAIVYLPKSKNVPIQLLALIFYLAFILFLFNFGMNKNVASPEYSLKAAEDEITNGYYESAVAIVTQVLDGSGQFEAPLLFQRAYAFIELGKIDLAIEDLERSVKLQNDFHEAYFNLAILYQEKGLTDQAKSAIIEAYQLNKTDHNYQNMYEKITGEKTQ